MHFGENFEEHTLGIKRRVQKQINFWSRFSLSLPGRINVAKSMLYSQTNYLGSIVSLSEQDFDSVGGLIENYVRGNLNIAKKIKLLQKGDWDCLT